MPKVDRLLPCRFRSRQLARLGLALVLLATMGPFLSSITLVWPVLPLIRKWHAPDAQYRALLPDLPYDLLRAADAHLPRDAAVLLITPGTDVQNREYRLFHRALYFLAPRPVWWLTPAPPDGTWKARWRLSAPLTAAAIRAIAAEKQASYALAYGVARPVDAAWHITDLGDGDLFQLDGQRPLLDAAPRRPDLLAPAWPIRLGLALAGILAVGATALLISRRCGYHAQGVELAALSWVLGAGLTSILMLWVAAPGGSLRAQMLIVAALAVCGLLWMGYRRLHKPGHAAGINRAQPQRRTPGDRSAARRGLRFAHCIRTLLLPGIMLVFLGVQVAVVTITAVGKPLEIWDSWVTWGMKARIMFLDGAISTAVYADPSRAITHLDYPLLVPLTEAWLYGWLGAPDDRLVGTLAVLFYLALAGICYAAVRRWGGTWRFALVVAVTAVSLPQVAQLAGSVFADVPLATLVTITAIYLIEWLDGGPPGALLLAATAGGLLPWTKREGLVLVIVLCLALLLTTRGAPRAWLGVAGLLLGAAIASGPWWGFVAWKGIANTDFLPVTMATWQAHSDRWPQILRIELASLWSADWGFVWPIAALTGLLGLRADRRPVASARRSARLLPGVALLYLGLISPLFVFSAFVPYEGHVLSAAYRLIAHVTPLPLLWMACRACGRTPGVEPPAGEYDAHRSGQRF